MDLIELAGILSVPLPNKNISWQGVSTDTRTLQPEELFIALVGKQFDGHHFLKEAASRGAAAALVEKPVASDLPILLVSDTRLALGQLASHYRQQFKIPILAITGSVGKTTVKEMTKAILAQCGSVLATTKNYNNDIGLPLGLLQLRPHHQYGVFELGTNHRGELPYLAKLIRPDIALITNIAPTHLAGFDGQVANVATEKSAIYQFLERNGTAVVNLDESYLESWRTLLPSKVLTYSMQRPADLYAEYLAGKAGSGVCFRLITPIGNTEITLPLLGRHQVMNALAASSLAYAAGAPLSAIKKGLESMVPVTGRVRLLAGRSGSKIIDDTYNASPQAVKAALQLLAEFPGKRIFVFGGMAELGDKAKLYHQEIGEYAAQLGIDALYSYGEFAPITGSAFGSNAQIFSSPASLVTRLQLDLAPNVTCLVKGARSTKMEELILPSLITQ